MNKFEIDKIVIIKCDKKGDLTHNNSQLLQLSLLTNYETFQEQIQLSNIIDTTKKYVIFLKMNESKVIVKNDNFKQIMEKVIDRRSDDDVYFVVQEEEVRPSLQKDDQGIFFNF